jgi:endonuclease/exonuclease/phosphatase family metal-dependent hydrolase
LVVATFNVRTGFGFDGRHIWPLRRRAAAGSVRQVAADILGLQEAQRFQIRSLARVPPGYQVTGESRTGGGRGEHCPILSRSDRFEVVAGRTEWFGGVRGRRMAGATFPRIATLATLRDRSGAPEVDVINTHLDEHRPENRWAAAAELAGWITPGRPTVLMGDLNTTRDDEALFEPLASAGLTPVDHGGGGTTHQFTGRLDGAEIDHILVSPELEVVEAAVVANPKRPFPSDHWPIRAVLRWRVASPEPGPH